VQFENNMTRFARYLTSLEKIEFCSIELHLHEDDILQLDAIDIPCLWDEYHNISTLFNLKYFADDCQQQIRQKIIRFLSIFNKFGRLAIQ
jgi:hypothetical protein